MARVGSFAGRPGLFTTARRATRVALQSGLVHTALTLAALTNADIHPHVAEAQTTSPYGILVNGFDHTTPQAEIATAMQNAKDAGAGWVRTDFWWYSAEWFHARWNWDYFDAVVQEATSRGLQIIPILWGTPTWAATDQVFSYGVPDMAAWENFVAQTVARYKGQITVWEIWKVLEGHAASVRRAARKGLRRDQESRPRRRRVARGSRARRRRRRQRLS